MVFSPGNMSYTTNDTSVTYTINYTTNTTNVGWTAFVDQSTGSTMVLYDGTWASTWDSCWHSISTLPHESPEQQAIREARWEAQAEIDAAASVKARELLLSLLTEHQRDEFTENGYFHVHTKDGERVYRLKPSASPVRVKGEDGSQYSYCIHPPAKYPPEDVTAAHLLMLETEEDEFLSTANATRLAASVT